MISLLMKTPQEMAAAIARRAKAQRLRLNLSQRTLAARSGVRYGTLKKFERTGQIAILSLLKLAITLGSLDDFDGLFTAREDEVPLSLDALLQEHTRKRGRQ